ncbi:hypothetical protein FB45DRAFT_840672 [Roridomyces roridus]|uniref:Cell wall galactomannoprotein n=1 Tax=Roridomyces roridus TaxID=1738132 RepID=A0AAD7FDP9_9AGAR|nr:hypothetical protein FB45DRAFT_840672 [Roridomyces roridus]
MARFTSLIVALFVASASVAAPVETRGIGSLACNIDRAKIVAALVQSNISVGKIDTSDPDTATAVTAAKAGLSQVTSAIESIAEALFTGQAPPDSARVGVSLGLNATRSALDGITNPAVSSSVAAAQTNVQSAIDDGNAVLADCS